MYPRVNYEMTEEDLKKIIEACKPTVCIKIGDYTPPSPQENANRAWEALGKRMGFDSLTVRPIPGKGDRFFSAVPTEAKTQRKVYIVCDYLEEGIPNIYRGRILDENGLEIGRHQSSSLSWLRKDLINKIDDPSRYEIVDFVGQDVPERFKFKGYSTWIS